jgi:uncharacterized cupin superfamily protein
MAAGDPVPRSLPASFDGLTFFPGRSPGVADEAMGDAFALLADYRDGGIFVGHWAGTSEWERHRVGDEIVHVVDGETTIFFLVDGEERAGPLGPGDLVVVPQGTWHRFETPVGVQVLTVTPQPTDHSIDRPGPDA